MGTSPQPHSHGIAFSKFEGPNVVWLECAAWERGASAGIVARTRPNVIRGGSRSGCHKAIVAAPSRGPVDLGSVARRIVLAQNGGINDDLQAIKAALAEIDDDELRALIAAANGVPQTAPGLLAWIDGACQWEFDRRRSFDYPLLPPDAAIPPEEDAVSIDAAIAMRATFAQDSFAVQAMFDALVELLTGAGDRH